MLITFWKYEIFQHFFFKLLNHSFHHLLRKKDMNNIFVFKEWYWISRCFPMESSAINPISCSVRCQWIHIILNNNNILYVCFHHIINKFIGWTSCWLLLRWWNPCKISIILIYFYLCSNSDSDYFKKWSYKNISSGKYMYKIYDLNYSFVKLMQIFEKRSQ